MLYIKLFFAFLFSLTIFSYTSFALEDDSSLTYNLPIISSYVEAFPKIGEANPEITDQIITYLLKLGDNKLFNQDSSNRYREQINAIIEAGEPMKLLILGFPCKSKNTDTKVISDSFDLADYLGLVTLQKITEEITSIYSPGCRITIYNKEPYIEKMGLIAFANLNINPYPRDCIEEYETILKKLIQKFPNLILAEDFSEEYEKEYKTILEKLIQEFPYLIWAKYFPKEAIIFKELVPSDIVVFYKNDLDTIQIKNKIESILKDSNVNKKISKNMISKHQIEIAKMLTIEREIGTKVLREIVNNNYNDYVRLSIRGDETKIGINLIYGSTRTPWHMSLLVESKSTKLVDRAKLEKEKSKSPYVLNAIHVDGIELKYITR